MTRNSSESPRKALNTNREHLPANEEVVVTAGLVATGGGGVQDIKVALALSGPEAMRLFQKGGEAARSFKSAGQPAQSA